MSGLAGVAIDLLRDGVAGRAPDHLGGELLRLAVGALEVVVLSLLLRWGIRRWVQGQPPDTPRRP